MEIYIFVALGSALLGYIVALVVIGRRHVKAAMFDEIERHHRTEMRRIIGEVAPSFSEPIRALSAGFCEIYEQANAAESYKLSEVCGLGYGRALEFLVKDYAKALHPDKHEDIESKNLGVCISTYVADSAIQEAARLATWLRNDQAHYVKRFEDRDVSDLKRLIVMTVAFIEQEHQRKKTEALLGKLSSEMRRERS